MTTISTHQYADRFAMLDTAQSAHVFYCFEQEEAYIQNAVAFIQQAVQSGDPVLFIENDRLWRFISLRLHALLPADKLQMILHQNNFEFFSFMCNVQDPSSHHYINEAHQSQIYRYAKRIWSHIEWNSQSDFPSHLAAFEEKADRLVKENGLRCVCAYQNDHLSPLLKKELSNHHDACFFDDGPIQKIK